MDRRLEYAREEYRVNVVAYRLAWWARSTRVLLRLRSLQTRCDFGFTVGSVSESTVDRYLAAQIGG
jgi:hypothetical protein